MRIRLACLTAAVSVAAALLLPATAEAQPTQPLTPGFAVTFLHSQLVPEASPAGANDWSCEPTVAHPRPVVLVHGTYENRFNDFGRMAPALVRAGFCVFALNYGDAEDNLAAVPEAIKGTGDIRYSAKELAVFVDRVLERTGAEEVDVVGHSQGGLMPRQYLKAEGGADKVANLVTLGATHHGTSLIGIASLVDALGLLGFTPPAIGVAAQQQVVGSEFLQELNSGGDTVPGVAYTVIATVFDEVTTPYKSTYLSAGPGATVRNVTLQDGCAIDLSDHLSMTYSPRAIGIVRKALDPAAPQPPCELNAPLL
ncbi:esterase/lipase family protein [Actinokineospora bangkokensis]|uniref:esterase/lipase family protein n=1 Tax=Actinokineospora bangkokensis TaxID=1193682 RepID=UPI000B0412F1|nr:alpha/beta fold hydrolase [Actinokineospora bangkokensis]